MKTRKYGNQAPAVLSGMLRMTKQYGMVVDDGGEYVRKEIPADRPKGLLGALMVRSGSLAPLPPTNVPAKRKRGRPPKTVAEVAAKVWDDVTDGQGVVLANGKPVEVPQDLP